jgi:hypothetical protein
MITIPEAFSHIPLNNYVGGACSPQLDEDFLGLRIAAPETVFTGPDMVFPVCGSYRFAAAFWNRFECLRFEMAVVAVDARTHLPRITNLRYRDFTAANRKFNPAETGFDEKTAAGSFNADLLFYREDFPRTPATYHVFALIGDQRSNVLTVKVAKP